MEFLTSGAKKAFIYQQKTFTKASIFTHFDLKHYIRIKTDILGYLISGILNWKISDQHFSDHITNKANDQTNLTNPLFENS